MGRDSSKKGSTRSRPYYMGTREKWRKSTKSKYSSSKQK
jgi:hypothetical protein